MAAVTPKDLYDRLKGLYGGIADEKIAPQVGVSTRTLARWKKNEDDRGRLSQMLRVLELAGYLDNGPAPTAGQTARLREALDGLREDVEQTLRLL